MKVTQKWWHEISKVSLVTWTGNWTNKNDTCFFLFLFFSKCKVDTKNMHCLYNTYNRVHPLGNKLCLCVQNQYWHFFPSYSIYHPWRTFWGKTTLIQIVSLCNLCAIACLWKFTNRTLSYIVASWGQEISSEVAEKLPCDV